MDGEQKWLLAVWHGWCTTEDLVVCGWKMEGDDEQSWCGKAVNTIGVERRGLVCACCGQRGLVQAGVSYSAVAV